MPDYGAISLVPTVVVLGLAIWSHRTIESVIAGAMVAFLITSKGNFLSAFSDAALTVMQDENTGWVLLVCGLYGSFIALLVKGGGAQAFGDLVTRHVKGKRGSLMWTWALPILTFVTMAFVSFTTGSNWGVFAIAIPVIFPLAQEVGVSVPVMAGALFSASGFGSQAFYSDSTVLTAQGAGCAPYEHAITQLPYALLAAGISAVGFLLISF